MNRVLRSVDANINRASEGIRVLEDIMRFHYNRRKIAQQLRDIRHRIRKSFDIPTMILQRHVKGDVGRSISASTTVDKKKDLEQLITANFKRVQEALRSIEEQLKIADHYEASKCYEALRFEVYTLEKEVFKAQLPKTDLYFILGECFAKGRTNLEIMEEALKAGLKIIQYREKDKPKREQLAECQALMLLAKQYKACFIVNDHVDIALAVDAHGVHLGQDDMPIASVRNIAPHLIIGVSTHNMSQVHQAVEDGADYIGVGPMYPTTSKKHLEHCEGINFLRQVEAEVTIPYVAIGGIKQENVRTVSSLGAICAMISEIAGAADIQEKVRQLKGEYQW